MLKVIIVSVLVIILFSSLILATYSKLKPKKQKESEFDNPNEGSKGYTFAISMGLFLTSLLLISFLSSFVVSEGRALTQKCLGTRDVSFVKTAGFYMLNPFCSYTSVSVAESFNKFTTDSELKNAPLTADKLRMFTTVNMPVSVNPVVAPYLLNFYLTEENYQESVIQNSVWDAIRRGFAKFYWEVPTKEDQVEGQEYFDITQSRDELVQEIRAELQIILEKKLIEAGVPENVANIAFKVGYPTISGTTPPPSVSESIEEQKKAEAELKRQSTITAVATEKAKRGTEEGNRVKNLLKAMPGFDESATTPEQSAMLINALATLTNAEALEKGIAEKSIEVWVVDSGNASITPKK
jgi:regulator of protease activity HflC (stomatin/prohibitin superfamily)